MKIGEFSEITGLPVLTIRYYMDIGLLHPKKEGRHWVFTQGCLSRAGEISKYKACGFSLASIAEIVAAQQDPALAEDERARRIGAVLDAERQRAQNEAQSIRRSIRQIDGLIHTARHSVAAPPDNSIPLQLFSLIACPHCDRPLDWVNVALRNGAVCSGAGSCKCGFRADIVGGILVVRTTGPVLIEIVDDDLQTLRRRSARDISYVESLSQWMLSHLTQYDLKNKVVYEDVINTASLLNLNIPKLDPDCCFILCDTDLDVVRYYVASIRTANPNSKLLFIVDDGVHHPIKKGSLDVVIDCASSEIIQRYGYRCIFDILRPYCHADTLVAGRFSYLYKRARPLQQSKFRDDPAAPYRYNLGDFRQRMAENGIRLLAEKMGTQRMDELVYDGCEPGDIMKPYAFFGRWAGVSGGAATSGAKATP